jgi:hypothetical protein
MSDSYKDFAYVAPDGPKRRRWPVILLIVSLIVNVISAAFVWWTLGLSVDASDSLTPAPPITDWTGAAIVTFLISSLTALFSAILILFRKNHSH